MITIYGKDACPYTQAARRDHEERGVAFEYVDVRKDAHALQRMIALTHGSRAVPVIVGDDGRVTIGFGGT